MQYVYEMAYMQLYMMKSIFGLIRRKSTRIYIDHLSMDQLLNMNECSVYSIIKPRPAGSSLFHQKYMINLLTIIVVGESFIYKRTKY